MDCLTAGLRRFASLTLILFLVACASDQGPVAPKVLANNDDFMIVRVDSGDSWTSLSRDYLKDVVYAGVLEDINGQLPKAGSLAVLPKKPANPSGVSIDGYQVVPVLCYHQFSKGKPRNRMQVSAANFEAQMRYLLDNNYRVITLDDLGNFLQGNKPIPKRAVVVTIDDGYRSTYDIALPILDKLDIKATLYVYSDFAGVSMKWDEIKELKNGGVIDIQNHSKSHTSMSPNGDEAVDAAYLKRVNAEIAVPDRRFAEKLGTKLNHFAYPYGDTSAEVMKIMAKFGYDTAATVQRGGNAAFTHPFLLRRDMVFSDHTIKDFKKFLAVYKQVDLK